jgi:hypothetical protein
MGGFQLEVALLKGAWGRSWTAAYIFLRRGRFARNQHKDPALPEYWLPSTIRGRSESGYDSAEFLQLASDT